MGRRSLSAWQIDPSSQAACKTVRAFRLHIRPSLLKSSHFVLMAVQLCPFHPTLAHPLVSDHLPLSSESSFVPPILPFLVPLHTRFWDNIQHSPDYLWAKSSLPCTTTHPDCGTIPLPIIHGISYTLHHPSVHIITLSLTLTNVKPTCKSPNITVRRFSIILSHHHLRHSFHHQARTNSNSRENLNANA